MKISAYQRLTDKTTDKGMEMSAVNPGDETGENRDVGRVFLCIPKLPFSNFSNLLQLLTLPQIWRYFENIVRISPCLYISNVVF